MTIVHSPRPNTLGNSVEFCGLFANRNFGHTPHQSKSLVPYSNVHRFQINLRLHIHYVRAAFRDQTDQLETPKGCDQQQVYQANYATKACREGPLLLKVDSELFAGNIELL
jgi:hypothetical protein